MSAISTKAKKEIIHQIDLVVSKYLKKVKKSNSANSGNPFVMALLKDFEPLLHRIHGLKTSLGTEMEKVAEIIAKESWGEKNIQRKIELKVNLPQNVFQKIDSILSELTDVKCHPNYQKEKAEILKECQNPNDNFQEHKYEFDIRLKDPEKNQFYYLEMKGPDPNTTEVPGAKRRLLTSLAYGFTEHKTENVDILIGIYYNNQFPKPYKNSKILYYFDPAGDMKVHDNFWNFIGRNNNTFDELVSLFETYGKENKNRIWDGFSKLIDIK